MVPATLDTLGTPCLALNLPQTVKMEGPKKITVHHHSYNCYITTKKLRSNSYK